MKNFIKSIAFLALIGISGNALADDDYTIFGTVTAIDTQNMNFTIKNDEGGSNMVIKVNPATDFELKTKNNMLGFDRDVSFQALQVNDWVEVEFVNNDPNRAIAKDVEIRR